MSELGGIVGDTLAGIFGSPVVGVLVQALVAAAIVLWLASAWWVYRDLATRTYDPVAPYLAAAGVLLATPLGFPLALVVYRLVRPANASAVEDVLALRIAALNVEPEARCRGCGREVDNDWRRCPACGTQLTTSCEACGQPVGLTWSICAWCAAVRPATS
jgi:hypothetical protein